MSAFHRSFPLIFTSFINKTGTIGLSLIPMILVEHHISSAQSSQIMTFIKGSTLAGTLLGGYCCDRLGLKNTLLTSFLLAALGLAIIPQAGSLYVIVAAACIAAGGQAMYPSAARLLITTLAPRSEQQESIGWLRTANNLGMVGSFSLGWVLSGFGIGVLMYIDSATSIAAAVVGYILLKAVGDTRQPTIELASKTAAGDTQHSKQDHIKQSDWSLFILTTFAIAGFALLVELFFVSAAAHCRVVYGSDGLSIFSRVMLINTVLCAALAVPASKLLKNSQFVFPAGIILNCSGIASVFFWPMNLNALYVGAFLYTLGEVTFMALSTFTLIRVTPKHKSRGRIYSASLLVQQIGKIAGAAAAFPMLVHGKNPVLFVSILFVIFGSLSTVVGVKLRRRLGSA